jgi:glycosyltransferase involved in cell wall biosynthesis
MKIAVLTHADQIVGGAESYLDTVLGALAARGYGLAVCAEVPAPNGTGRLAGNAVHARIPIDSDPSAFFERLAGWKPDVVFLHGLDNVRVERGATDRWPSVFFAHTYHGTCISSSKTWSFPSSTPCTRTLGLGCLVRYLPRRCGGLSPVSMWTAYRLQQDRHAAIPHYTRVLTLSQHMRAEFVRHGASSEACHVVPHFAPPPGRARVLATAPSPLRLLFAGRMERLKGTHVFVDTLPIAAERLGRPVHATLVGDGRCRGSLERQATACSGAHANVRFQFTGWLPRARVVEILRDTDLLVVPSLWPEPFGLVGPEAGAAGVPAAAFDVGGIPEWLLDGETGRLARGPRTASSLADAIVGCVGDVATYAALSAGALAFAARRTLDAHVTALEAHLAAAAGHSPHLEATVAS